jgi:hypothetical protein
MNNSQRPLSCVRQFRRWPCVSAVFCVILLAEAAIADNYAIVPGHSIGKAWIGAPRDATQKILGKPTETHQRNDKTFEDIWLFSGSSAKQNLPQSLKVLYSKNRVVQIETTAPQFSIEGLSLRSDPYQIRKRFGPMRVSVYNSVFNRQQSFHYYYDNAPRGITFSVRVHGAREVATRFQSVIVHRKGHQVVPEPGETFLSQLWDKAEKKP